MEMNFKLFKTLSITLLICEIIIIADWILAFAKINLGSWMLFFIISSVVLTIVICIEILRKDKLERKKRF